MVQALQAKEGEQINLRVKVNLRRDLKTLPLIQVGLLLVLVNLAQVGTANLTRLWAMVVVILAAVKLINQGMTLLALMM
jgi:hypothetical protein